MAAIRGHIAGKGSGLFNMQTCLLLHGAQLVQQANTISSRQPLSLMPAWGAILISTASKGNFLSRPIPITRILVGSAGPRMQSRILPPEVDPQIYQPRWEWLRTGAVHGL